MGNTSVCYGFLAWMEYFVRSKKGELVKQDKVNNHLIAASAMIVLMTETFPTDPYKTLAAVLGVFTYVEEKHEKVAEGWLKKVAHSRHGDCFRS